MQMIMGMLLALVAGAVIGYLFGARGVQAVENERDMLSGRLDRLAKLTEAEFTNWKSRVAVEAKKIGW